jgi:diguanylate cyclase (GGDEF)-like protein
MNHLYTSRIKELDSTRCIFIVALIVAVVAILTFSLCLSPYLERSIFENYGLLFEFCVLILLLFVFGVLQFAPLNQTNYLVLSTGLLLWVSSSTIDVADEIVKQPMWLSIWGEDLLRMIGILLCAIGVYLTIHQASASFNKVKYLATMNELTELPNRRYFRHKLSEHEQDELVIMLLDLDHFKRVNDIYGHDKGDTVLHVFGKLLSELTLSNAVAARLGGEEFAVFMVTDDRQLATDFSNKLIEETRTILIGNSEYLSVSIGGALKAKNGSTHDAMKQADDALYLAKANGRGRFEWSV